VSAPDVVEFRSPLATEGRPGLAVTYGSDSMESTERLLPLVDLVEVSPDTLVVLGERGPYIPEPALQRLALLGARVPLIVHGVGLSIGTYDGCCESYLQVLDQLFERVPVAWHSEHLAFTTVDGEHLGTMLPLPRTDDVVEMISRRVEHIRLRYGVPFLLEHVVHLIPDPGGRYSHAAFLNSLAKESGCGLLIDAYNLDCDRVNGVLDVDTFLRELDPAAVVEIHLAGGVEYGGLQVDVHSRVVPDSVLDLCSAGALATWPALRAMTYEYLPEAEAAIGVDTIAGELVRLRNRLL
jgi:uncharacterized protein (UPF0276 family)